MGWENAAPGTMTTKPADSSRIEPVLEAWLSSVTITGADTVRATLARKVAAELDDAATPKHAVPRLISQLHGLISEMDPLPTEKQNGRSKNDVRALLENAIR